METIYYKYELINENPDTEYYEYKGKSKFIIPIWKKFENLENNLKIKWNNDSGFIKIIYGLPDTEIENLLNFHFTEFSGDKNLFLIHTEQLINGRDLKECLTKKDIILHWIKEKKTKKNEPKQQSNHKEPKRTDHYKTVFNQKEITLFAYFLRDREIILKNTNSNLLADCFGKLTDYSITQIYKNLKSVNDCFDISDNKEHYQKIISELKKLIEHIENEIKTNRSDLNIS